MMFPLISCYRSRKYNSKQKTQLIDWILGERNVVTSYNSRNLWFPFLDHAIFSLFGRSWGHWGLRKKHLLHVVIKVIRQVTDGVVWKFLMRIRKIVERREVSEHFVEISISPWHLNYIWLISLFKFVIKIFVIFNFDENRPQLNHEKR